MIAVKQKHRHVPWRGGYSDCHRAAIASLFHLSIDNVPHFADGNPSVREFNDRVDTWLAARNLTSVTVPFTGELNTVLAAFDACAPHAFCLLTGASKRGINHTVICRNGRIVHDPSPDRCGVVAPSSDGYFWFTIIVLKEPDLYNPPEWLPDPPPQGFWARLWDALTEPFNW